MRKTKTSQLAFRTLNDRECEEINGGGFAYDVGYFLRMLSLSCGTATGYWMVTESAAYIAMQ